MNALALNATHNQSLGDNMAPHLSKLSKLLQDLGKDSIKSTLAKPRMAIAICRAAQEGIIDASDAEMTYEKYLAGRAAETGKNTLAEGESDKGSLKANVSKNKQIIELGLLPKVDGPELLDRVTDARLHAVRTGGEDIKVKPAFDCFVDAARAQLKKPNEPLTDEEINALVRKAETSKDKTDLDRMVEEYKRLYKLANGTEENPGIPAMMPVFESIAAVFDAQGIDRPAMTKDEKKAEKAMAFLRTTGRI